MVYLQYFLQKYTIIFYVKCYILHCAPNVKLCYNYYIEDSMKKKRGRRKNKSIILPILMLMLVLSLCMSISYAILSKKLNLTGNITLAKKVSAEEHIASVLGPAANSNNYGFNMVGNVYFFAGKSANNYFKLGTQSTLWRIVSIDSAGIRLIRDYDASITSNWTGSNSSWADSNALATLKTWYNNNLLSYQSMIVQNPSFTIGEVRTNKPAEFTTSYVYNGAPIGMIDTVEFSRSNSGGSWMTGSYTFWTTTSIRLTVNAFRINESGKPFSSSKVSSFALRPVIVIKDLKGMTGSGTSTDPFKF